MSMENPPTPPQQHFLFVTSPMQGHINPTRRLAALVTASNPDARVTFCTTVSGHRRIFPSLASPDEEFVDAAGVLHAPYSDGFDDGFNPAVHGGAGTFRARASAAGRETLSAVVARLAARGRPVTCVVYTFLVPWVPDVARAHGVPAALFWIQPAAVFAVYYHYFHGHDVALAACANGNNPDATVTLPGLPPLKPDALPSLVSVTSPEHRHHVVLDMVRECFLSLDEHRPRVLVNTLDALEPDALRAVPQFEVDAVGPVVPLPDDVSPSSSRADLLHCHDAKPYMEWLWVARKAGGDGCASAADGDGEGAQGMVVDWCDQVRVLSHPAVGCFMTHCGWNSTLESLTRAVPMVAVPQWTDQPTVAWLVDTCMGAGVRARVDGEGVVERGEVQRCVEMVMDDGEAAAAIRAQSDRWRDVAREVVVHGGSSERNLRAFALGTAVTDA